jgi:hypothetical protein
MLLTAHHLPLKMTAMTAAADPNCTFGGSLPSTRRNDSGKVGVGHLFARIAKKRRFQPSYPPK